MREVQVKFLHDLPTQARTRSYGLPLRDQHSSGEALRVAAHFKGDVGSSTGLKVFYKGEVFFSFDFSAQELVSVKLLFSQRVQEFSNSR